VTWCEHTYNVYIYIYIYLQHGSILVYMSPHRQTCQPLDNCNLLCYRLTMMNRDNDCGQASSQRLIVRRTRLRTAATVPSALPLLAYGTVYQPTLSFHSRWQLARNG